jgi:hypothetical protein
MGTPVLDGTTNAMRKGRRTARTALVAVLLACAPSAFAQGTKHALLVGVGDYIYDVPDLEGPPHDIQALQKSLTGKWGFDPRNIKVLLDHDATKAGILAALDSLSTRTKPSDYVFIYFSGHGTSSFERSDLGLDGNTGAVVPADFNLEAPDLRAGLVVGSRDLRPRLEKLDKDREVFVVFDSCYSGAAVRSLRAVGRPRYVPMPTRGLAPPASAVAEEDFGALTAKSPPYPYTNTLYISAASKSESARDVTSVDIGSGRAKTVDGKPHGALTNSLLDALSGSSDTNHDGMVSYEELYEFIRDEVTEGFPQQPQLLIPEAKVATLKTTPIFRTKAFSVAPVATAAAAPPSAGSFRVRLEKVPAPVAQKIRAARGVTVTDGGYDLMVALEGDTYTLFHGSGDVLASFPGAATQEVVERVSRQVAVQELIDLTFPAQDFNVTVSIPGDRGFLIRNAQFSIEFASDKDAYILLLTVDNAGKVGVLYPYEVSELVPARKGGFSDVKVSPPFGTEYLKVFAFREKPQGFDKWRDAKFLPTGPELGQLLQMIRTARGSKAQGRLKVVTRETSS